MHICAHIEEPQLEKVATLIVIISDVQRLMKVGSEFVISRRYRRLIQPSTVRLPSAKSIREGGPSTIGSGGCSSKTRVDTSLRTIQALIGSVLNMEMFQLISGWSPSTPIAFHLWLGRFHGFPCRQILAKHRSELQRSSLHRKFFYKQFHLVPTEMTVLMLAL